MNDYIGYYFTENGLFYKLDNNQISHLHEFPSVNKYYDDTIQSLTGFSYNCDRNKVIHDNFRNICTFLRKYSSSCPMCQCKHSNNECISIANLWTDFVNREILNMQENIRSLLDIVPATYDKILNDVKNDYKSFTQTLTVINDIISALKQKIETQSSLQLQLENRVKTLENIVNIDYPKIFKKLLKYFNIYFSIIIFVEIITKMF